MSKKKKPKGEIVAGIIILAASSYIFIKSFDMQPGSLAGLYIAIPLTIIGLVILLSKDATNAADTIFKYLDRL